MVIKKLNCTTKWDGRTLPISQFHPLPNPYRRLRNHIHTAFSQEDVRKPKRCMWSNSSPQTEVSALDSVRKTWSFAKYVEQVHCGAGKLLFASLFPLCGVWAGGCWAGWFGAASLGQLPPVFGGRRGFSWAPGIEGPTSTDAGSNQAVSTSDPRNKTQ